MLVRRCGGLECSRGVIREEDNTSEVERLVCPFDLAEENHGGEKRRYPAGGIDKSIIFCFSFRDRIFVVQIKIKMVF